MPENYKLLEIGVCLVGILVTIVLYYISLSFVVYCISKSDSDRDKEPSFITVYVIKTFQKLRQSSSQSAENRQKLDETEVKRSEDEGIECEEGETEIQQNSKQPNLDLYTYAYAIKEIAIEEVAFSNTSRSIDASDFTNFSEKSILRNSKQGEIREKKTVQFSSEIMFSEHIYSDSDDLESETSEGVVSESEPSEDVESMDVEIMDVESMGVESVGVRLGELHSKVSNFNEKFSNPILIV